MAAVNEMRLPDFSVCLQAQAGIMPLKGKCIPRVQRVVLITDYSGLPSTPDRPAKSRKPQTSQKVGSRAPRLAFPPLNTVAVYSRLFDGGSKQTSISTACFQLPSNPDRTTKSRQLPTFSKVGSRVPRLAFPPLNTVAVYSRLFDGGSKQTSISIACFQLPSTPTVPQSHANRKPLKRSEAECLGSHFRL